MSPANNHPTVPENERLAAQWQAANRAAPTPSDTPEPTKQEKLRAHVDEFFAAKDAKHEKIDRENAAASPDRAEPHDEMNERLDHTRSCPLLNPMSDEQCTCGLQHRIDAQTWRNLYTAWRKRAEEAEGEVNKLRSFVSSQRGAPQITPEIVERWMDERGYYSVASVGVVTLPDYDGEEGISFERDSLTEACELADRFMNEVPCLDDVGAVECERLVNEWLLANDPHNFAAAPSQGVPSTKGDVKWDYNLLSRKEAEALRWLIDSDEAFASPDNELLIKLWRRLHLWLMASAGDPEALKILQLEFPLTTNEETP